MRSKRSTRAAGLVGVGLVGLMVLSGCREQPPEPPHNRNLGDKPGELMPPAVSPADARILEDQRGVTQEDFDVPARRSTARRPRAKETEPEPAPPEGGPLADLLKKARQQDAKAAPAKTPRKPAPKPTARGAPKKRPAKPSRKPSTQPSVGKGRSVDSITLKMDPPWKPWKPPIARNLVAAYTQKGVGDVAAWSMAIPKNIKPEMLDSQMGRLALATMLKRELTRHFKLIDKWDPVNKTAVIDGVQAVEASCALKKGPVAGIRAEARAVCFGIVGKTKGFLVTYRVPADGKTAAAVRKAVLAAIKLK